MWQQVSSGTPMGTMQLKRCFFKIDADARYTDVREAIASHRSSDGGDGVVTLVLERPVNSSVPLETDPLQSPRLAPLQQVLLRDLTQAPSKGLEEELERNSVGDRIASLLGGTTDAEGSGDLDWHIEER